MNSFERYLKQSVTYRAFVRIIHIFAHVLSTFGDVVQLSVHVAKSIFSGAVTKKELIYQCDRFGVSSLPITLSIVGMTSIIVASQVALEMVKQGGGNFIGLLMTILIVREVGAIMSGFAIISMIAIGNGATSFMFWETSILSEDGGIKNVGYFIMFLLPLFGIPGSYWLSQFLTWDKEKASPGAMGNLSGTEIALAVTKYYKEHPEKMPKNTRLVVASFGAEESGLKGSLAYCKAHKKEFNKHTFVIK